MINEDTVKLLRECSAGVKMGVEAIDDIMPRVSDPQVESLLFTCKQEHEQLGNETDSLLNQYGDVGKEPSAMAQTFSKLKTGVKLAVEPGDGTAAELMVDGCNMGVKSLSGYLNEYAAAEEQAKNITRRLIQVEEKLAVDLRPWL